MVLNYDIEQPWEIITHLVTPFMRNKNGAQWEFLLGLYLDTRHEQCRGMPIGKITSEGFISNHDDKGYFYKMIYDNEGCVMFLRKKRVGGL